MAINVNRVNSVPAWKQSVLERRQLLDEKQEQINADCSSQMPQWKREVLLKKRNEGKDVEFANVILDNKRSSNGECCLKLNNTELQQESMNDVTVANDTNGNVCENDEHLVPIRLNPIWKSDAEKRHSRSLASTSTKLNCTKQNIDDRNTLCKVRQRSKQTLDSSSQFEHYKETSAPCEDGDDDSELVYGQGFVSRLLNRFHQMSLKQENSMTNRSISTDNLFNDCQTSVGCEMSVRGGVLLASRSVDNLIDFVMNEDCVVACNDNSSQHFRIPKKTTVELNKMTNSYNFQPSESSSVQTIEDEFPKPNTVVTVRTVFEQIGNAADSYRKKSKPALTYHTYVNDKSDDILSSSHSMLDTSTNLKVTTCNKRAAVVNPIINSQFQSSHNGNSELRKSDLTASCSENDLSSLPKASTNGSEISKRNRLNLNLSDAPSAKKGCRVSCKSHSSIMASNHDVSDQMHSAVQNKGSYTVEDSNYDIPAAAVDLDEFNHNHDVAANHCEMTHNGCVDDDRDFMPREGDPSDFGGYRRIQYEFVGAGVIVDRSLLSKSKNTKQMTLSFNESATVTHEYPSEQSFTDPTDFSADLDSDDSYYDSSISSYKLRSMPESTAARTSSVPMMSPASENNIISLNPADSDLPVWSNSATSDLLF